MTVLEFLAAYAALFLTRAQNERIPGINVLYNEHEEGGYGYAYIHNEYGGVHLTVGFPLLSELKDAYTPELTDEQWAYFKENISGSQINTVTT